MNGKGSTSDLRRTLIARSEELTRSADLSGVDAVVWPEGGFYFLFGPDDPKYPVVATESRKLVEFVRDLGRPVIFGSLTSPAGKPRNSLVLLRPDGTWQTYDKRRLLAFGEHLPLSETFPSLKGSIPGVGELEPGTGPVAFPLAATSADGRPMTARALASICYEAILPDLTRESVVDTGADVIVNVTNDVWFGPEGEPAQHLMLQAVRAVELRIPLVRVTQTGITAVVLPSGDFAAETAVGERRVVTVDVPFGAPSDTLYRSIGEAFPVACLLGVVAFLAVPWARRRLRSV
jgi:apolipoprotein N-acyltransferase